ncbi:peptidoglycan-binding domain-containing protein [Streptomyces sp. NPDC048664]|uniref:peptidoglycan-binding domain-containing protein n=1 Tax=Streptomyces sp. NPDC048664 TaxID=3154505 RepID=UPI0034249C97
MSSSGGDPGVSAANEAYERTCPECSAPRRGDGTPSCGCTLRASDALRDARTEEAAAAEDFDPLRIRPYVDLPAHPEPAAPEAPTERTMRLAAVQGVRRVRTVREGLAPPDETVRLGVLDRSLDEPPRRGRRGRGALLAGAGAGAVAVVLAAAGFASGLFSYSGPERDSALPEDVRASVPDQEQEQAPSARVSAPPSAKAAATPRASASPSRSGSPSPSASSAPPSPSASASASASAAPGPSATSARPSATASRQSITTGGGHPLRYGDNGPAVTDLQLRLNQLNLYGGPANGHYGEQVENAVMTYQFARDITDDDFGVYGPATRAMLESETYHP